MNAYGRIGEEDVEVQAVGIRDMDGRVRGPSASGLGQKIGVTVLATLAVTVGVAAVRGALHGSSGAASTLAAYSQNGISSRARPASHEEAEATPVATSGATASPLVTSNTGTDESSSSTYEPAPMEVEGGSWRLTDDDEVLSQESSDAEGAAMAEGLKNSLSEISDKPEFLFGHHLTS